MTVLLHIPPNCNRVYSGLGRTGGATMSLDDKFINPIERSLLNDLVDLYTCDLTREAHLPGHFHCIACSKEEIIRAILHYRELDERARVQSFALLQPLKRPFVS